jgi:hypothetical protein
MRQCITPADAMPASELLTRTNQTFDASKKPHCLLSSRNMQVIFVVTAC